MGLASARSLGGRHAARIASFSSSCCALHVLQAQTLAGWGLNKPLKLHGTLHYTQRHSRMQPTRSP